ncbi:MAG: hypothetical protein C5B50_06070 [Verrucomicrobia bacterium]|nr:MAG: hypothetical protein C5B50_06070 [Verrucomicrobiota bacterium]
MWNDEAGAQREATLTAGRRIMRARRWKWATLRICAVVVLLSGIAALILHRTDVSQGPVASAPPSPPTARFLTDDQLLALFPGTPVGLAKVGDREVLVFPRPEDEQKFVGKF